MPVEVSVRLSVNITGKLWKMPKHEELTQATGGVLIQVQIDTFG